MYPPRNHLQVHDHEEDRPEDGDNCRRKDEAIGGPGQETFHDHYHVHQFEQPQYFSERSLDAMWGDLVSGAASIHRRTGYDRPLQEGSGLASPTLKSMKRKAEMIEVLGSGRKDKHSKVCTARGPRDRRVRLSPKTAIRFYDVQDRLGYDRPSKAIDWLIKEAKTAIDALDEQPPSAGDSQFSAANFSPPDGKFRQMQQQSGKLLISECGMIEKHENMNDGNSVSSFSFLVDGAASPASYTELQAYREQDFNQLKNRSKAPEDAILFPGYQQGLFSASSTTSQMMDTNWEVARLQKVLTGNCVKENSGKVRGEREEYTSPNSPPLHFPAQPMLVNSQTLSQTEPLQSTIINYSPISINFPGFSFSNELSNVTAAAKQTEDEKEKPVLSKPYSASSFLHYQGGISG